MYIEISISIAVFAVVVSEIISGPGDILCFYRGFLEKLSDKGYEWLARPLGYCPKCFAGQIALWGFLFLPEYNLFMHIFFIAWSIFFAEILTLLYGKIQM